jgi:hypothetical protein
MCTYISTGLLANCTNSPLQTLGGQKFDAVYDMNAREVGDTQPLADLFLNKVDHYVFMSSAGVYLKSDQVSAVC